MTGVILIGLGVCGILATPVLAPSAGFAALMFVLVPALLAITAGVALVLIARDAKHAK